MYIIGLVRELTSLQIFIEIMNISHVCGVM